MTRATRSAPLLPRPRRRRPGPSGRRREGYLRLGVQGQVRREDFRPEGSAAPFEKTVTGAVGPYVTWSRASFLVTRGVRRLRARGGRRPRRHRAAGSAGRAEGLRLRARRHRPAARRPPRRAGARRLRLPRGAGRRALRRRRDSTAARCSSPPRPCCSRRPNQVGILHVEGGWLKDPRAGRRSSTSAWASGPARSGATPSPATAPTSRRRSIG